MNEPDYYRNWVTTKIIDDCKFEYGYISDDEYSRYFVLVEGRVLDSEVARPIVKLLEAYGKKHTKVTTAASPDPKDDTEGRQNAPESLQRKEQ